MSKLSRFDPMLHMMVGSSMEGTDRAPQQQVEQTLLVF